MVKPKSAPFVGWEPLIPSKFHYFQKFKDLDDTDLNIIFKMAETPDSPRNVRKISRQVRLPQQTVNYRVQRFDREGLVRFRAVINEALLGLANYITIVTVKPGLVYVKSKPAGQRPKMHEEIDAETFLTCYPVWRLAEEIHGGPLHGFCVIYSIPPEKENDLRLFFEELEKIGCILQVNEFRRVAPSRFSIPRQDLLQLIRKQAITRGQPISFNWESWVDQFDESKITPLTEEIPRKEISFEYEDLIVLSYLEGNLREKFVEVAKEVGEPSGKIAKRYKEAIRRKWIDGCRVEIYPIDPVASMHLTIRADFTNGSALRKFVTNLNEMPYPVTYQKVIGEDGLFLHVMIPSSEYVEFHNTFETLNRRLGIIRRFDLYVSSHFSKYDNVMLYKAFSKEEGSWEFSKTVILKALRKKIDDTRFTF